ncbi:SDR family oxidoreductase [Sphaerisporangium sp. NBC_01403]|uniref:SDR family oxidoreductase n=1 Tax=Sphaerisporangium sp. NBC_01403 TaxID=2903599 RepID=UPI003250D62F
MDQPLKGKVAVVAGATRGAGRGIAVQLGAAGATVYATGRTTRAGRSPMDRPETIEETAELVTAAGGAGIAVQVDHLDPAQVEALARRVAKEQDGRLDVLVNDIWGGDPLTRWGVPFYEHSLQDGLRLHETAVHTHIITSWHLVPLMVARGDGLVVEITDGDSYEYRGSFFYDLAKVSVMRLAVAQAKELGAHGITALSLTPGFLRSEAMLDHFGVTEDDWRAGTAKDPHFIASETPVYVGRAVAALAADPDVARWSGQALSSWRLAKEYGFRDADGTRPDWGGYMAEVVVGGQDPGDGRR